MNKLVLMITLALGVSSVAQGAPLSYIFNHQTDSMVVFKNDRAVSASCDAARLVRPDAQFIEVASTDPEGHPVYVTCK